jgi:hypothetical protein
MRFMTYKAHIISFMGAFVEDVWHLRLRCTFSKPIFFPFFYFFHVLRNKLKATILVWCLDNDSVIHKYLTEMRRLAHDETPFLSVV